MRSCSVRWASRPATSTSRRTRSRHCVGGQAADADDAPVKRPACPRRRLVQHGHRHLPAGRQAPALLATMIDGPRGGRALVHHGDQRVREREQPAERASNAAIDRGRAHARRTRATRCWRSRPSATRRGAPTPRASSGARPTVPARAARPVLAQHADRRVRARGPACRRGGGLRDARGARPHPRPALVLVGDRGACRGEGRALGAELAGEDTEHGGPRARHRHVQLGLRGARAARHDVPAAVACLGAMAAAGVASSAETHAIMVKAVVTAGDLPRAEATVRKLLSQGARLSASSFNTLISACMKATPPMPGRRRRWWT